MSACLQSVRVVQRNLVYVVGLSMDICHEDTLRTSEFFGQFGKPVKVRAAEGLEGSGAPARGSPGGCSQLLLMLFQG